MPRGLKYETRLILLWVARNYLSRGKYMDLINDLAKTQFGDVIFMKKFQNHIDIEMLRKNPVVWQDIWIYNYIIYDFPVKRKFKRTDKLILQYEREILIPTEHSFLELMSSLNF